MYNSWSPPLIFPTCSCRFRSHLNVKTKKPGGDSVKLLLYFIFLCFIFYIFLFYVLHFCVLHFYSANGYGLNYLGCCYMTIGVYGSAAYALQCDTFLCWFAYSAINLAAVSVDRERLVIKTCVIFARKNILVLLWSIPNEYATWNFEDYFS